LHLLCPSIIYPEQYSLLDPKRVKGISKSERRGLILVAKTLFYVSVGQEFESSEPHQHHMIAINNFIRETLPKTLNFLAAVSKDDYKSIQPQAQNNISNDLVNKSLMELQKYITTNANSLINSISSSQHYLN